ncbi:MAG: class I SAM-dependent methyltransferase [archaeon]
MNIVEEIKKKREFSGLPDSIVERVAEMSKGDVKESRALLRKYFGVFLTNKILKGKISADEMLVAHMSSKKRDYEKFYEEIFLGIASKGVPSQIEKKDKLGQAIPPAQMASADADKVGKIGSVIDLGCGVNGFSYKYLRDVLGEIDYVGVEATGQLVEYMNRYFKAEGFSARAVVGDLFDIESVLKILKKARKDRVVFLFQVVDALENLERDFSKRFILEVSKECEGIVLSLPTESLGGRKKFAVRRKWIMDFLESEFVIEKDFVMEGERIIFLTKKDI